MVTDSKLLVVICAFAGCVKAVRTGEQGEVAVTQRMPREQRRAGLLEAASALVREEGTDALTLARVAERAGVTKPIAYEHFGTRSGLLIALYQHYDQQQTRAMRTALEVSGRTLEDVARILSAAYVDCAVSAGPAIAAITAALSGTDHMEELLRSCRDSFMEECRVALSRFVELSGEPGQAVLLAVIGAAEALSHAAAAQRMPRDAAVETLSRVMVGALRQGR